MQTQSILIADQDTTFVDRLVPILNNRGFTTICTSTGAEALHTIRHDRPSLVLLELLLPDTGGEEICKKLKSDPLLKQIPIIIVTSKTDLDSKLNCWDLGVEEYLVKPVMPEELAARIVRLFKLMKEWRGESMHQNSPMDSGGQTLPTIHTGGPEEQSKTSNAVAAESSPEKLTYGVYRVENIAGRGGMGLVYKAHDPSLDRYVAIKVLSKEWSSAPEFVQRFQQEAKLIAALNHPGIAQIYTFARQGSESYFALQWCSGGSVANFIRTRGKIALLAAIDIVEQCARALEAAWGKSIVHRDIKPSNLMFDEDQQIRIVDFGIAYSGGSAEPFEQGGTVGSPAYISPEQGRGEATDHRTDLYSLGISFYQMLYARLPFTAKSPLEFLEKHNRDPFPPYDSMDGTVPRGAYRIIEKMTQKSPAARYQTYSDLLLDLAKLRRELYSQRRLKIPEAQKIAAQPLFQGNDIFDLLANVFRSSKSGVLKCSWANLEKKFIIAGNDVVHFVSSQTDENIWSELVNRKLLKKEDLPKDQENLEESLNRVLYLGVLKPEDFKNVYRELMARSLEEVFLWPVVEAEFHAAEIRNEPLARIAISQFLVKAARELLPMERIQDSVRKEIFIVRTPGFEERLTALNLPRDEYFLAARIEGTSNTTDTLQVLTGFDPDRVLRIVHLLERAGVVQYQTTAERRPRRIMESSAAPPSLTLTKDFSTQPQKISEVQNTPRKQTTWIDSAPQFNSRVAAEKYKRAQEKFATGNYREVIQLCGQAIQNQPAEASYHFLMGQALAKHPHSIKAAIDSFRHAIHLNSENVQYRMELATFLKDKHLYEEAYRECEKILEMSPSNRKAALLLRQIELER